MQRIKEISNLMKLDFICIRKKSLLPLICGVIVFSVFGLFIAPIFVVPIIIFSELAVHTMFTISAKNDFNKLYGVLPVHRSSIVFAHFLLGLLSIGAVTALVILAGNISEHFAIFKEIDDQSAQDYYNMKNAGFTIPMTATLLFAATCVLTAMEYSIVFILGVEKEILGSLLVGIVLGLISCIVVMSDADIIGKVSEFLGKIYDKNEFIFYTVFYVFGIVFMMIFSFITSTIIGKREL